MISGKMSASALIERHSVVSGDLAALADIVDDEEASESTSLLDRPRGSEPEKAELEGKRRFRWRKINTKQRIAVGMVAFTSLMWSVVYSCIGPFFPGVALSKGATTLEIGVIFGVFELAVMIGSPVFGRLLPRLGPRPMYLGGILTVGVVNILYGFLEWSPPGAVFVWTCLILRVLEALGAACYFTATLPILATNFPHAITTALSIEATFSSLGFVVGPVIGGSLFELGGFHLPFMVLGCGAIVSCFVGMCVLPPIVYRSEDNSQGLGALLRIPVIVLVTLCGATAIAGLAFLDATLAPHLQSQFQLSTLAVSFLFLAIALFEAFSSPFVGVLVDTIPCHIETMIVGTLLGMFAFLLAGPTPLIPQLTAEVWISVAANLIIGLSIALLMVPPAGLCFRAASANGLPDSASVHGAISGLLAFSSSFGGFFGPTLGSYLVERFSFAWATTAAAALLAVECVALVTYLVVGRRSASRRSESEVIP